MIEIQTINRTIKVTEIDYTVTDTNRKVSEVQKFHYLGKIAKSKIVKEISKETGITNGLTIIKIVEKPVKIELDVLSLINKGIIKI